MSKINIIRPSRLPDGSPMEFAPENEQGVVFLFSHLSRKFGVHVEKVQAGFPDCIAIKGGKRIRIEFEYRSKSFSRHRHPVKFCDWIVCWIHDWPAAPERLHVIELRREYGLGFNVWIQPVRHYYSEELKRIKHSDSWTVPSQASVGDLILFYSASPEKFIRDIFIISEPVKYYEKAEWKQDKDYMAKVTRVGILKAPIHLSQLQEHRVLKSAGFVRGMFRKGWKATTYWPELYRLLIDTNPRILRAIRFYEPSRVL